MKEKMKKIILVTHGKKKKDVPNPSLTKEGRKQMEQIREQLRCKKFDLVISGTGRRHKEACKIIVGRKADLESELMGTPTTLSSDGKHMILSNGEKISFKQWEGTQYKEALEKIPSFLKQLFNRPEKNILIVGGRIAAIGAEIHPKEVKSARIYYVELTPAGEVRVREGNKIDH